MTLKLPKNVRTMTSVWAENNQKMFGEYCEMTRICFVDSFKGCCKGSLAEIKRATSLLWVKGLLKGILKGIPNVALEGALNVIAKGIWFSYLFSINVIENED